MNSNKIGTLGESRVISELIKNDYDVFTQFSGKSSFDLVAYKDELLYRVEVKSTSRRTKYNTGWEFQLKRVRPNRTGNTIYKFDNTSCDIVALYIEPLDKVLLLQSNTITVQSSLVILDSYLGRTSQRLAMAPDLKSDECE